MRSNNLNLHDRFKEIFKKNTYTNVESNSTSIRVGIYQCSVSILKDNWLFGLGIGDVQEELNNCYLETSDILYKDKYNSHNQYLSIWLGTGILGIILLLNLLYANFRIAWIYYDKLYLFILLLYSAQFFTENLLERQSGVILFFFIISFFGFSTLQNKNISKWKKP